ncbi:MAG: lysylphosphatidylglycerol synthase transmembrane domain-containing protein [Halobacteriales archaeon]
MTRDDGSAAADGGSGRALPGREAAVKIVAGFAVAVVLVYLLGAVIGWEETLAQLRGADLRWFVAACLSTAVGLAAWAKAWQVVLAEAGTGVRYRKLVTTYFAATFANYVTPLGQAGGEPFIAFVLSRDTEANYEESLASVVTADLLNLLPFFNFAVVGVGFLLFRTSLGDGVQNLAVGLGLLGVGIPAIVVAGWHYRDAIERGILAAAAPVAGLTRRVSVESVRARIERFYGSVDEIASDRSRLLYALVFSYTGWVFFTLPLYFAGLSLDLPLSLLLVLFIVPASTVAGMVPTPGGLAAVEGALTWLVAGLTAVTATQAFAIATVYRLTSYWFALAIGGGAALWVIYRA